MASRLLADNASAALADADSAPRGWRLTFTEPLERQYLAWRRQSSWHGRALLPLTSIAVIAIAYVLMPLVGGVPIGLRSPTGLLICGLLAPSLLLVALTAAIPPLRRFSDAAVLVSMVLVTVALAGALSLERTRQPLLPSDLFSGLYLIAALCLLEVPVYRSWIAASIGMVGAAIWLGQGRWAQLPLRIDLVLLLLLVIVAAIAAFRSERASRQLWRGRQVLATSARRDYLTGLLNRRSFEAEAALRLDEAVKSGSPAALLLLDIDFFKSVNDLYGHARGDQVLKDVAAVIGRAGRLPADLCARYGGEEFAVLWTACGAAAARRGAETLLLEIRRLNIENKGSTVAPVVTASAGLIAWETDPAGDIQDAIGQADHLLYMAKRSGRNRLVTLKSAQREPPAQ